jgi:hypothetical protein
MRRMAAGRADPNGSGFLRGGARKRRARADFLGTHKCICGKRVRVYGWLPECPLCARCAARIQAQEEKATALDV